MEEKCLIVNSYFDAGKSGNEIFKLVCHLGIKRLFIFYQLAKLRETGSIYDRPRTSGPQWARTKKLVKIVIERIHRNPQRSTIKLAFQLHISKSSIHGILRNDLH